ncbi:hypothetical protein OEZ85_012368 [Tetradesmus obliquus]|uniref:EGF-like domain-containing protein n=1 Tax=Tetradesmus obliquus TaxID=3088 RepID=A0ABY8TTI3_TETOB|nr:hypothetical protein OEZ85_012368 [Tetradesmus obliquus]
MKVDGLFPGSSMARAAWLLLLLMAAQVLPQCSARSLTQADPNAQPNPFLLPPVIPANQPQGLSQQQPPPNPCAANPCRYGGTCRKAAGSTFKCQCLFGYSGQFYWGIMWGAHLLRKLTSQQLADVLKELLQRGGWGLGMCDVLEDLQPMQLGSQLTGDELLQLLRAAIRSEDGGAVGDVASLTPAAHQIDDIAGYTAFLQEAMRAGLEYAILQDAALDLPATQLLPVAAVLDFIQQGIKGMEWKLPHVSLQLCEELPAAQQGDLGSAAVRELLLLAFEQQQWDLFDWLRKLPAAPLGDEQVAFCCEVRGFVSLA